MKSYLISTYKLKEVGVRNMVSQKKLIYSTDWDCLIVLDACRYDYLKNTYKNWLDGTIIKVKSPATCTSQWLENTFKGKKWKDVIYVSANPYINSLEKEPSHGVDAKNHFYKVFDVWDDFWNSKIGTVKPKHVSKVARIARAKYPEKRLIIHFMQPHDPYFSIGTVKEGDEGISSVDKSIKERQNNGEKSYLRRIFSVAFEKLIRNLGSEAKYLVPAFHSFIYKTGFWSKSISRVELVGRIHGNSKLRLAYAENLNLVMKEVKKTVQRLPDKKIVITADHGELLGENGLYEHPRWINHPILTEVPWLELEV